MSGARRTTASARRGSGRTRLEIMANTREPGVKRGARRRPGRARLGRRCSVAQCVQPCRCVTRGQRQTSDTPPRGGPTPAPRASTGTPHDRATSSPSSGTRPRRLERPRGRPPAGSSRLGRRCRSVAQCVQACVCVCVTVAYALRRLWRSTRDCGSPPHNACAPVNEPAGVYGFGNETPAPNGKWPGIVTGSRPVGLTSPTRTRASARTFTDRAP